MSQEEIVFGDVSYREPERRRRPDRDRRWACLAYEIPGPGDLPIFLDHRAADAIERHALRDTSVELGGILLGKECVDDLTEQPFVWVTHSLEARHYENTQASFTYTHDSWEEISRERERLHPDLDIVGWYHTHPDFGIFLSGHDLFIHHHFFAQPLQLAYVVDPVRQTRGFFQWRDGQMAQVGGFILTAARSDRVGLARLANELERFPNPEGGGGGFSPRLEAELIAMLSRPNVQAHSAPAQRAQSAALFALLGGVFGVIGLSVVLWLSQMNAHVAEQARAL
ncbi:MAG: Mov34/MPN/PAD-1 family protein, partial [Isosphaeraceae bacterium]